MKRARNRDVQYSTYHADLDTRGSPSMAMMNDGRPTALVLVEPLRPADLPLLAEGYLKLYSYLLTKQPDGEWDGSPLRVVLSRRLGEFWDLCVGTSGPVDKWLASESRKPIGQLVGQGEMWNYWDSLRLEEGYANQWLDAALLRGSAWMVVRGGVTSGAAFAPGLTVRIPAASILIRHTP